MIELTGTGIDLFGVSIRWYGLIIACAVLIAVILCAAREKKYALPREICIDLALVVVPTGIIGARVYYVLFNLQHYLSNPIEMLYIHQGGLAIYGGIIAGVISAAIYARVKKLSFWRIADLIAPALALAQAMGRWGNYFNQEAYGRAITDEKWQFFPAAIRLDGGTWHYATFFYESMWCLLICVFLLIWERGKEKKRNGDVFFGYAFLYATERFLVESLRMDSLFIGPFRISQVFSFAIMLAVTIALCTKGGTRGVVRKILLCISLVLYVCAVAILPVLYVVPFGILTILLAFLVYRIRNREQQPE